MAARRKTMPQSELAIAVDGLSKSYGPVIGADRVTFSVDRGEIFGFLGPNGAGKTTCIRLLLNLIRPDSGRIEVLGQSVTPGQWRYKSRIGILPGELSLWPVLTGLELLDFFDRFNPRPATLRPDLLDGLGLDSALLDRKVRTYSKGTRWKLGIAIAMQNDPDLLVLDEPTSGLDPLVRHSFFEFCKRSRRSGKTVFLSSHNLAETNEICDRVGIIRSGRMVALQGMAELKEKSARRVEAVFADAPRAEWFDLPGIDVVEIDGERAVLACRGDPAPLLETLAARPVLDLVISPPALDDLFRSYFSGPGEAK